MKFKDLIKKIEEKLYAVTAVFDLVVMQRLSGEHWVKTKASESLIRNLEKNNFARKVEICFEELIKLCEKHDPLTLAAELKKIKTQLSSLRDFLNSEIQKASYDYLLIRLQNFPLKEEPIHEISESIGELEKLSANLMKLATPISMNSLLGQAKSTATPTATIFSAEIQIASAIANRIKQGI